MSIVTLCGNPVNEADCFLCLRIRECREVRETICQGCKREYLCPTRFKHKRAEAGMCRGRELVAMAREDNRRNQSFTNGNE